MSAVVIVSTLRSYYRPRSTIGFLSATARGYFVFFSRGSVATCYWCGGRFDENFVPLSVPVKELLTRSSAVAMIADRTAYDVRYILAWQTIEPVAVTVYKRLERIIRFNG